MSAADIPLLVISENSSSERRINPSWTLSLLKTKLEPITGIPPSSQLLTLRVPHTPQPIALASNDEEATQLASYPLQPYAELHVLPTSPFLTGDPLPRRFAAAFATRQVSDTRPSSARLNLTDTSAVEKYEMPVEHYEKRADSVLAWKKRQQLGRFDPAKDEKDAQALQRAWDDVHARGIVAGARARTGGSDGDRRGTVRYVGEVPEIPNGGLWVGFEADEPTGKNNGSIGGKKYFTCKPKHGSFLRPDRIEIGDFPVVDDFEDMEEI